MKGKTNMSSSSNHKSFKLTTKNGESKNGGCLVIIIATIIIFGKMFSAYNSDNSANVNVTTSASTFISKATESSITSMISDTTTYTDITTEITTVDTANELSDYTIPTTLEESIMTTVENELKIKLHFGNLLEVNQNDDIIVIKAKYDNLETVLEKSVQNIYWIVDENPDCYSEIQYWAVADVNDEEIKIISFTVNSDTISSIANHYVSTSDIENNINLYLDDYYNIVQ